MDYSKFSEKYEFKDPQKEQVLDAIKGQNKKWVFSTGFAIGFFVYFARERKNKYLLLPAAGILIGSKYYSDMKRNEQVKECELD